MDGLDRCAEELAGADLHERRGRVDDLIGLIVEATGLGRQPRGDVADLVRMHALLVLHGTPRSAVAWPRRLSGDRGTRHG